MDASEFFSVGESFADVSVSDDLFRDLECERQDVNKYVRADVSNLVNTDRQDHHPVYESPGVNVTVNMASPDGETSERDPLSLEQRFDLLMGSSPTSSAT